MIKNYLKTAVRLFTRQKGFTLLNLFGLAIGMACAILISTYVFYMFSFDKFHTKLDNIYRVEQDQFYSDGEVFHVEVAPAGLSRRIERKFPEVVDHCTYTPWGGQYLINYGDKSIKHSVNFADIGILRMFNFPLIKGDTANVFLNKNSIILTEEAAQKLFGDEDPMGKTISMTKDLAVTVTGILQDIPENSFLQFEMLAPFALYCEITGADIENIGNNSYFSFVELAEGTCQAEFDEKIRELYKEFQDEDSEILLNTRSFGEIFLYAPWQGNKIRYVKMIIAIGLFVLLIACINFMNLATARSANRAKEVGIRKVAGAPRRKIILQFIGEGILMASIAHIFAMIMAELILPHFNTLVKYNMDIQYSDIPFVISLLGIILFTGIISGSYPAFYLSRFNPTDVLKGSLSTGSKNSVFRRVLVVFQFTLSIMLLITTIVVGRQYNLMQNKDLGLNAENVIAFDMEGDLAGKHEVLRAELKNISGVKNVTYSNQTPFSIGNNGGGWQWDGKPDNIDPLVSSAAVGLEFTETFDIKMIDGRFYDEQSVSDTNKFYIIINKYFADLIGEEEIIGTQLQNWGLNLEVLGVIDNYHFLSVDREMAPLALYYYPSNMRTAFVKIDGENTSETLDAIKAKYNELNPDYPFEPRFIDENIANMYQIYSTLKTIFTVFAILAIIISCLGLFGLASYMAEQKSKEIGIRKALGSSIFAIIGLFSKEFSRWILFAMLIATPVSYFALYKWLQNMATRTPLSWWIFALAGLTALFIALITVSYQSIKAASRNPVESLRYE